MLYTKQQLIDAYCASEGVVEGDLPAIIITVQAEIDARIASWNDKVVKYQNVVDNLETDAKTKMKLKALRYLAFQEAAQSVIDNEAVSL